MTLCFPRGEIDNFGGGDEFGRSSRLTGRKATAEGKILPSFAVVAVFGAIMLLLTVRMIRTYD